MTPFLQFGPYIAIDFETSSRSGACACAVGMVRLENLRIVDEYYTLIRPPSSRVWFTSIHGLTWAVLKNEKPFAAVWPEMRAFIRGAKFLIAHNARFDRHVLHSCCEASSLPVPTIPFLCTLAGSRKALRLSSYGLQAVCDYFNIDLNHHHAGSDAAACGLIHCRLTELGISRKDMLLAPPRQRQA